MRFVFVTGGVISSLGKGLTAASLGTVLKSHGFSVRLRKLDPYINVDPGTLSPYQHGEVFVMDDGTEADLDCGNYERFTGLRTNRHDCTTTGQIYQKVIQSERQGKYLGRTVQVIPHITDAIKEFLSAETEGVDILIAEIGGTVGDIESLPFLEALRQLRHTHPGQVCCIHVGWVPFVTTAGEHKTKPMQHSVHELQRAGIQPDILLLRSEGQLPPEILDKVGLFCNVLKSRVVCGLTQPNIYALPEKYHEAGLDAAVLDVLKLTPKRKALDLSFWQSYQKKLSGAKESICIGIVGKYGALPDVYKSLYQALEHAGTDLGIKAETHWIDPEIFEKNPAEKTMSRLLSTLDAVLVPGGFGSRGIEGIVHMIRWARTHSVPFFGICLGMQLAVIESLRTQKGFENAHSAEFKKTDTPAVHQLSSWEEAGTTKTYAGDSRGLGGTMRLGLYPCDLQEKSLAQTIYGKKNISERHRHRYEVNLDYQDALKESGLHITGLSPCGKLPEIIERPDHPFFLAVQFHPEYLSSPMQPHPLFSALIKAGLRYKKEKNTSSFKPESDQAC